MSGNIAIPEKPANEMVTGDDKEETTGEATATANEADNVKDKKAMSLNFYITSILLQTSFVGLDIGIYMLLKPVLKRESKDKIQSMKWSSVAFAAAVILQLAVGGIVKSTRNRDQKYILTSVCMVGYPLLWGFLFLQGAMYFCSTDKVVPFVIGLTLYAVSVFFDFLALKLLLIRLQSGPSLRVANAEV